MLTREPLVMNEHPKQHLAKAKANLCKFGWVLLVLRRFFAIVVSAVDYIYEAMPPHLHWLRKVERAPVRILMRGLQVCLQCASCAPVNLPGP